eukprot:scaffold4635_cov134-Skeletonema_dohrnii-CCMP3373.AAC.2
MSLRRSARVLYQPLGSKHERLLGSDQNRKVLANNERTMLLDHEMIVLKTLRVPLVPYQQHSFDNLHPSTTSWHF